MDAYSKDLRLHVFCDCDAGMTTRLVATKYGVSESWVRRLKQRRRENGETLARRPGSCRPARWLAHADRLQQLVHARPDITLPELRDELNGAFIRRLRTTFRCLV
jgi:transposase